MDTFLQVVLWTLLAAVGTSIGGLLVFVFKKPSNRLLDGSLGLAAGVMLSALAFGLIPAAIAEINVWLVSLGIVSGAATLAFADRFIPHEHPRFEDASGYQPHHVDDDRHHRRGMLVALALTLHNIPEGAAVGAAFAAGGAHMGIPLAIAIAVHNIPEGFAVVAPLIKANKISRRKIAALAAGTGIVEIPAALIAYAALSWISALLPFALAFAAGAMLWVCVDEMIPEAAAHGNERVSSSALVIGFLVLLILQDLVASMV